MNILVFDDREALAKGAAEFLLEQVRAQKGHWLLAGGSTPRRTYQLIANTTEYRDYKYMHIFFGDERMVPADHAESNYGMVKRAWLAPTKFPPERIHRIRGELEADRAARLAEEELRDVCGDDPVLDLAILGMGTDGHTASLFPGSDAIDETDRLFVGARAGTRVSATLPLLHRCAHAVFIVAGANKAEAVRQALYEPPGAIPASLVATADLEPLWLLDSEAASLLP